MSEHSCNDGCNGSYKPARKIEIPRARFPLILDQRIINKVPMKGILELGSLLYKNELFFTNDASYKDLFVKEVKAFPEVRANLYYPVAQNSNEYKMISLFKDKEVISEQTYKLEKDIALTFSDESLYVNFCQMLKDNTFELIPVSLSRMLTLKSIAGVEPYDFLLAELYLKQHLEAYDALNEEEQDLVNRIKEEGLSTIDDNYSDNVKKFLKVERKLFLQYNSH